MNCCASIVKYLIYIVNVVFVICGILIITIGAIMLSNMKDIESVGGQTLPILIIVLGSIVFVVSFLGCCGAIRENFCCMTSYAVCMFILGCLQIALVAWVFNNRSEFLKSMEDAVKTLWNHNAPAEGFPMNKLEIAFNCCGKTSYKDYYDHNAFVPSSCCGLPKDTTCPESIYVTKPGCIDEFVGFWSKNLNIIRYVGLVIAAIEFGIFIIGSCLACRMRH